jgi:hypothetical protein
MGARATPRVRGAIGVLAALAVLFAGLVSDSDASYGGTQVAPGLWSTASGHDATSLLPVRTAAAAHTLAHPQTLLALLAVAGLLVLVTVRLRRQVSRSLSEQPVNRASGRDPPNS